MIFISSCDKEVSVSGPYEYQITKAKYFINTEPDGAEIFVDGKNTGLLTPDTVKWLAEGLHKFLLKKEPYLDYEFEDVASITEVKESTYSFLADPTNFGSIIFTSIPDSCEIYMDDALLNHKTPYTLQSVLPGKYKIKYTFPEHRADSQNVFVYAGKQISVNMQLSDTTIWVTYNKDNSFLPENTINDVVVDNDDNVWVGTWHNGLIKINGDSFEFFNKSNSGLPSNIINRIAKAPDGSIWIATYVGLARINNGLINSFTTVNSDLPSNYVTDIDFESNGTAWIGTDLGLAKFDGNNWTLYNSSNSSIPAQFITTVLVDQYDSLWIGTNQFNTCKFDGIDTWKQYQSDSLLIGDSVRDLFVGNDGNVWVGLLEQPKKGKFGGIFSIQNDEMVDKIPGLPNRTVNRFYMDSENNLWIGTRGVLVKVNPSGTYDFIYASFSGLPINDVYCISSDSYGNYWFGTNGGGLAKYKSWKDN